MGKQIYDRPTDDFLKPTYIRVSPSSSLFERYLPQIDLLKFLWTDVAQL